MNALSPERLEHEGLIALDRPFALSAREAPCLDLDSGDARVKNISLLPGETLARGLDGEAARSAGGLMARFADWAEALVLEIAPDYRAGLRRGRTSLRTRPVDVGPISPRKDDRRLHVDAFASQPTAGMRILRVFANINPEGEARRWQVGEPFETHARRFLPRVRSPWPGETWLLERLGITKAQRTAYDSLMLGLHDASKLDADYQANAPRRDIAFAAGSSWVVFTDSTVHAALAGRHALEQTFYLPVSAMADETASPLRTLEHMTGRRLV